MTPADADGSGNEFTFDASSSGSLRIPCRVTIEPDSPVIDELFANKVRFTITDISGSNQTWTPGTISTGLANPDEDHKTWQAEVAFTGLPTENAHFGRKTVTLELQNPSAASKLFKDTRQLEVFFSRDATNHPGGQAGSPNWFYYWSQTVQGLILGSPPPTLKYSASSSEFNRGNTFIELSPGDVISYNAPLGLHNPLEGIDNFAWTVVHESDHYNSWTIYWSNSDSVHMAAIGGTGRDHDFDDDELPNYVEDVNLNQTFDANETWDWTKKLTPGGPSTIINDFEWKDCLDHRDVTGNDADDWADPGMQHASDGVYSD